MTLCRESFTLQESSRLRTSPEVGFLVTTLEGSLTLPEVRVFQSSPAGSREILEVGSHRTFLGGLESLSSWVVLPV